MTGQRDSSRFMHFQNVDSQPEGRVKYLDTVTGIDAIQAIKERSYSLLAVKPGQRVLDVGCGTGDDVRAMARIVGSSGRAVGVDNSEVMIKEAKKRSEGINLPVEFRVGDAARLPLEDSTFDATRAERMFQHLANPEAALNEMIRVTRPGGRVGVMDPDWGSIVVDSSDMPLTRRILQAAEFEAHVNPWMGRQLYPMFKKVGLEKLELFPINIAILDYKTANQVLTLPGYVDKAREKAAISREEGEKWLGELEERNRTGRFLGSLSGFGVFGTKPVA